MAKFDYSVKFQIDGLRSFFSAIDEAVKKVESLENSFREAFKNLSIEVPSVNVPTSSAISRASDNCNPCESIDNLTREVVPRIDQIITILKTKSAYQKRTAEPTAASSAAESLRRRSLMAEAINVKVNPIINERIIASRQQQLLPPSRQQALAPVSRQALPPSPRGGDLAIQPETQRRFTRKALPPAQERNELGFDSIIAKLAKQGDERQSSQKRMIAALDEALVQYQSGQEDLLPVIDQLVAKLRGPQIPAAAKEAIAKLEQVSGQKLDTIPRFAVGKLPDGQQGQYDPYKNKITISEQVKPEQLEAVLIAELTHALNLPANAQGVMALVRGEIVKSIGNAIDGVQLTPQRQEAMLRSVDYARRNAGIDTLRTEQESEKARQALEQGNFDSKNFAEGLQAVLRGISMGIAEAAPLIQKRAAADTLKSVEFIEQEIQPIIEQFLAQLEESIDPTGLLRRQLNNILDRLKGRVDNTTLDVSATEVQDLLPGQLQLTGSVVTETLESITKSLSGVNRLLLAAGKDAIASVAKATEKVKGRKKQLAELFEIPADAAPKSFASVSKLDELESLKRYRSLRDADSLTEEQTKELTELYNKLYAFASQSKSRSMSSSKGALTKDLPKILAKAPDFVPYKDLGKLEKSSFDAEVLDRGLPTFSSREEMEPLPELNVARKELPFYAKYQQLVKKLDKALATGGSIAEADLDALEALVNNFSAIAFLQKKRVSNPVAEKIRQLRPGFRSFDQFDEQEKIAFASNLAAPAAIQPQTVTPSGSYEESQVEELRKQKRDIELGLKEQLVNLSSGFPEFGAERIAKEIALRQQAAGLLKGLAESATEEDEQRLRIQERILELQKQAADLRARFISQSQSETDSDLNSRVEEIFRAGRAEAKPLEPLQTDSPAQKLEKLKQQLAIAKETAKQLKDFDKNAQLNPDGKAIFERRLSDIEQTAKVIESRITSITEKQKEFQRLSEVEAVKSEQRRQVNDSNEAGFINQTGSIETDLTAQIEAARRNADITEASAERLKELGADDSQMRAKALLFKKQELDLTKQLETIQKEAATKSLKIAQEKVELELKTKNAQSTETGTSGLYIQLESAMEASSKLNELAARAADVNELLAVKLQTKAAALVQQANLINLEIQKLESRATAAKDEISERKANIREISSSANLQASTGTPAEIVDVLSTAKTKVESELNALIRLQQTLNDEEAKQVGIVNAIAQAKDRLAEIQNRIAAASKLQTKELRSQVLEESVRLKIAADAAKPVIEGSDSQKLQLTTLAIQNRKKLEADLIALQKNNPGITVPGISSVSQEIKKLESNARQLRVKIKLSSEKGELDAILNTLQQQMSEISPDLGRLEKAKAELEAITEAIEKIEPLTSRSASAERKKLELLIQQRNIQAAISRIEEQREKSEPQEQFRLIRNKRTELIKQEEAELSEIIAKIGESGSINSPEEISKAIVRSLEKRIDILERINRELENISTSDPVLNSRINAEIATNNASQGALRVQSASQNNEFFATSLSALAQILPIGGQLAANAAQVLAQINQLLPNLGKGAIAAAASVMGLAFAFSQLRDAISVATEFERLEKVIENVSGSSRVFEKNMSSLERNIKRFAIRRDTATREYAQFIGATQGTPLEGQSANNIFESISQASRVYGLSDDRQSQAFLAVTQMISKQRVETEELKRQLSEALPAAYSTFAKALGVSQSELNELIRTNQVGLEEISKFAAQLKSDTALGLEGSNNLFQVRVNELSNAGTSLQKAFGEVGLNTLKPLIVGLTALVEGLAKNIYGLVGAFTTLTLYLLGSFAPALFKIIGAFIVLGGGPLIAITALGAALGLVLGQIFAANQNSPAIDRIKELGETASKSRKQLEDLRKEEAKRKTGNSNQNTRPQPQQKFGQNPSKDSIELEKAIKRFNRDVDFEDSPKVQSNFGNRITELQQDVNRINAEISIVRAEAATIEGISSRRDELLQREAQLRAEADGINQKIAQINTGLAAEVDQVKAFIELLEDKKDEDFKINQLYNQEYTKLRSILSNLTTEQQRIKLVVNSVNEGFSKMARTVRDLREETEQLSRILERQELQAQSAESQALVGDSLQVDSDDRITTGEMTTVGYVGTTGVSTGEHIDARMADRKGPPPKEVLQRIIVNGKPLSESNVTSPYGYRAHPVYGGRRFHHGIDFAGGNVVPGAPIQVQGLQSASTLRDPGGGGVVVTLKLQGLSREVQLLHNDYKTESLYRKDGQLKAPVRPARPSRNVLDSFDLIPARARQNRGTFNRGYERLSEVDQALTKNRIFQQDPVSRAVALMIAAGESRSLNAGNRENLWQQMGGRGFEMRGPFQFYTRFHDSYTRTREQQVNTVADMLSGRRTRANGDGRIDLSPIRKGVANGSISSPEQLLAAVQKIIPLGEWHGLHRPGGGAQRIMESGAASFGLDLIRQSINAPVQRQQAAPVQQQTTNRPQAPGRLTPEAALEQNRSQRQIANTEQLIRANQERFNALRQQVRALPAIPSTFLDREGRPNPTAIDRILEERKDDPKLQETGRVLKEFAEVASELDKLQRQRTTLLEQNARESERINDAMSDEKRQLAQNAAIRELENKAQIESLNRQLLLSTEISDVERTRIEGVGKVEEARNQGRLEILRKQQEIENLRIQQQRVQGDPTNTQDFAGRISQLNQEIAAIAAKNNLEQEIAAQEAKRQDEQIQRENEIGFIQERSRRRVEEARAEFEKLFAQQQQLEFDPANPVDLKTSEIRIEQQRKLNELKIQQLETEARIAELQQQLTDPRFGGGDPRRIELGRAELASLEERLGQQRAQEGSINRETEVLLRRRGLDQNIERINRRGQLSSIRGEIQSERISIEERRNGDPFQIALARADVERGRIIQETTLKVAELNRLLSDMRLLSEAGYESREEVQALITATEELAQVKLEGLNDQFKTLGATIQESIVDGFGSAVESFFTASRSLGDALLDLAKSILTTFAKIAAQGFTSNLQNLFGLGGSPVAGFGNILGGALNTGVSSLASAFTSRAVAAPLGLFGPGFAEGGYTGDGGRSEIAGFVHKGEMVFSQNNVSQIGRRYLDSMRTGQVMALPRGGYNSGSSMGKAVTITNNYNVPDSNALRKTSSQIAREQNQRMERAKKYS